MTLRRNVLIFHQAALGDFIVTWPLAMALSRLYPQSRIIYVTGSDKGKLAERALGIESADVESGWHKLLSDPQGIPERPAKLLAGAHTVLSFSGSTDDAFADAVVKIAPEVKCVRLNTRFEFAGHITESFRAQLGNETALATGLEQMLRSVKARGLGKYAPTGNRIVIHPGAGKEQNRWSADKFLQLAKLAKEANQSVTVLLGEVEIERWGGDVKDQFKAVAEIIKSSSLVELFDQLAGASVFVGNDSGPAHLAGIIGTPTCVLFGDKDPTVWQPLGPKVEVVRGKSLEAIEPIDVWNRVTKISAIPHR